MFISVHEPFCEHRMVIELEKLLLIQISCFINEVHLKQNVCMQLDKIFMLIT